MNCKEYLAKTLALMNEFRVPVRDTYHAVSNADDYYTNGNCYNGPRLFKIQWVDTVGFPEMKANKVYIIPPYKSAAYDDYTIVMPNRYKEMDRDDAIVHECVHFLQHNTVEDEARYIKFMGLNYSEYLNQRVEIEAHLVQVAYIFDENTKHRDTQLCPSEQKFVSGILDGIKIGNDIGSAMPALLLCKERGLL